MPDDRDRYRGAARGRGPNGTGMSLSEIQFYLVMMINALIAWSLANGNLHFGSLGFSPPLWVRSLLQNLVTLIVLICSCALALRSLGPISRTIIFTLIVLAMWDMWRWGRKQ